MEKEGDETIKEVSYGLNCACEKDAEVAVFDRDVRPCRPKVGEPNERARMNCKNKIECVSLPLGSEHIIKQIVAEQILFDLLEDKLKASELVRFDWICSLVKEYPGVCHRMYDFHWMDGSGSIRRLYPLSMLCCLKPPLFVIEAAYNANPNAVQAVEATHGSLPLHFLSAFESDIEVVRFVHDKYEQAITIGRKDSVLPLHLALLYYKGEPSVVHYLLDKYPQGATKSFGHADWSVLHAAVSGLVPDESLLTRIYSLHPESILSRDSHLQTPLHLAMDIGFERFESRSCHRHVPTLITFLVRNGPQAMELEDGSGWMPIFLAAIHHPLNILKILLHLQPNVTTVNRHSGVTILHLAAAHNKIEVVEYLAQTFPEMLTAQTHDEERDTPLSWACYSNAPLEIIRTLVRYGPRALFMTDAWGRTLPQVAARLGVGHTILQLLQEESVKYNRRFKRDCPGQDLLWH